jgi:hypothetical protein
MMTREYPFGHNEKHHGILIQNAVEKEEFLKTIKVKHDRIHPKLSELLLNCLEVEHEKRWTIADFKTRYYELSPEERQVQP